MKNLIARPLALPLTLTLALALPAVACGEKDESQGDKSSAAKATSAAKTPTKTTLAETLNGIAKPGMLGPFSKAKFGMNDAELKAAVPAYAKNGEFLAHQDYGVGYYAGLEGKPEKRLTSLRLSVAPDEASAVDKAWGAGTKITYRSKPATAWLNPETKMRAMLTADSSGDRQTLIIEPYMPATQILGEKGKQLGIETARPLLGSTPDELKAAYPANFDRSLKTLAFMSWTADEYGSDFKVEARIADGKIVSLQFWLHHGGNEEAKKIMLAALEAKYGPAVKGKSSIGRAQLVLAQSPKVVVNETKGAWVVNLGAH